MGSDSRIRSILNCERGMKPISGIVNSISELIGQLTLPAREKKELETGLLKLIQELERELAQARAVTVQEEVRGNWLQRSWRPLVMLVFALLILRGFWIALHARDRFGSLMVVGVMTLVGLQTFLNIGVVTGLLPTTGISLPFFSYGGTALSIQLAEMGIVLSVSRQMKPTKAG